MKETIDEVIAILDKEEYLVCGKWKKSSGIEKAIAKLRTIKEQPPVGIIEKHIKEVVFRAVHKHEVDISCSVHPCELQGLREVLKKNKKTYMGDV